jgi:hypothetical protein
VLDAHVPLFIKDLRLFEAIVELFIIAIEPKDHPHMVYAM